MAKLLYKILNTETGLYSSGGSTPSFKKTGKTWTTIGALKNHLALVEDYRTYYSNKDGGISKYYEGCVIVEYEPVVSDVLSITDMIEERNRKREKKRREQEIAREKRIKEQEHQRLRELASKHGFDLLKKEDE